MFYNNKKLIYINFGQEKHDTNENNKTMKSMFEGCSSLKNLSLINFNTENVVDMSQMFKGCNELISLDLSNLNTENVLYMDEMFADVINLRKLDLSSFDTRKLISYNNIWKNITELNIIINVDKNEKFLDNIPEGINITDINETILFR